MRVSVDCLVTIIKLRFFVDGRRVMVVAYLLHRRRQAVKNISRQRKSIKHRKEGKPKSV